MTNLEALAVRVEAASADEQRELIEAAFAALLPEPAESWKDGQPGQRGVWYAWNRKRALFSRAMLAEAYESAAQMLVPDIDITEWCFKPQGLVTERAHWMLSERPWAGMYHPVTQEMLAESRAATPALAVTAASLKAHAHQKGPDHGE